MVYGHVSFLDTSILISKKKLSIFRNYHLTASVFEEAKSHHVENYLPKKFVTTGYHDLVASDPELCPVFMNFFGLAFNPAVVASPDFISNLFTARKMKGVLEKGEEKTFYEHRDKQLNFLEKQNKNIRANRYWDILEKSAKKHFQKKLKEIDSEHRFNDCKTFVTAVLYSIEKRKHVTIETADSDFIVLALSWASSIAQAMNFNAFILSSLSHEEKQLLANKEIISKEYRLEKYLDSYKGTMKDLFNHKWQRLHSSFRVRYWDQDKRKYFVYDFFAFDELMRRGLKMHGGLMCYSAQNSTLGNWLRYAFSPPDEMHPDVIRFNIEQKINIKMNTFREKSEHIASCRYAHEYETNDLSGYVSFFC